MEPEILTIGTLTVETLNDRDYREDWNLRTGAIQTRIIRTRTIKISAIKIRTVSKATTLGLCAGLFLVGPVFGHAKLLSTVPAADAQLTGAPTSLTLAFNENVRLAVLKLATAGHDIPLTIERDAAAAPAVTIKIPPLAPGKYAVRWSVLTPSDGHVVKGAYSFVVR
jgi:copper resistance protein C